MSCASIKAGRPASGRRAFSLVELLVAMAVATAFMAGVYTAYLQISRAQSSAEARLDALRNGRAALTTMGDELKGINTLGTDSLLQALDATLAFGDGRDEDSDGKVDEEVVDGLDDDGDITDPLVTDRHALLDFHYERPSFVGRIDLDDANVDVDARFGDDRITFNIYTNPPQPQSVVKTVSYQIGDFDGQSHVLLRSVVIEDASGNLLMSGPVPLAFGVLGLDLLYWNPNAPVDQQGWVTAWDSGFSSTFEPPQLPLPASIYLRLTLYADRRPIESYQPGAPVDTLILQTIVNIEETIGDARFPRRGP
ncbi:MAG: prepilin-type N-terminal cleavage/methylation domain-containing protein [bacterium]|nr:prepilin-type N-terminal cleavage/methylation domain-containing protein [bacterium]